nr:unnamed protein product [Callosobruchus chinensis]
MAKTNFPKERQVVDKKTGRKSFSCYNCDYTVYYKSNLIRHMKQHDKKSKFIASVPDKHNRCIHSSRYKRSICVHCNMSFKKKMLRDNHVVTKHPSFITSISRKIYECTNCSYKTTIKYNFARHLPTHTETGSNTCSHCNVSFKCKISLDDHLVKKHPNFIDSVTRKIYECTKCNYKTTFKNNFERHNVSVHTASLLNEKLMCIHCKESFKSKESLDEHIVRNHPEFITSVGRKIYECIQCTYKTVLRANFLRHTSIHLKGGSNDKLPRCIHCTESFKSKESLDGHIVRKHPDFITSVDRKIYECTKCEYKTIMKSHFDMHTSIHPGNASSCKIRQCIHCNATFKSNRALDSHVVKVHPYFISSVGRKVYECTKCVYKTTFKNNFERHVVVHPESA